MAEKFDYKKITAQDIFDYISENAPEDKKWFKSVAYDENGKYQHLVAKKAFAERYMPEIIPVAKEKKTNASDLFKDW